MIYCNLKGGLGNMMFQIAASLSMAAKFNTKCSFPNFMNHLIYLNDDIKYNPKLKHSNEYVNLFKNLNFFLPDSKNIPTLSFPFHFVEPPMITGDCYIDGFFQSEKYFYKEKSIIEKNFSISPEWENFIKTKYKDILEYKTTSVHVRRGDYVKSSLYHRVLDLNYYVESIKFLENNTDLFIVFSDDINWCKENFTNSNIVFVENEKDYIELSLMQYCNNNIISNSSFSWWGAFLNKNDSKIVISPSSKSWFGPLNSHLETKDLIPENWIQI
jgi:hypothetical protein